MSRLDPAAEAGDATSPSFDGVPGSSAGALHDWLRRAELDKAKESRAEEKQELPVPELATPAPRSDAVVDSRLEGKCVAESSSRKDGSDHRRNREMTAGTNGRSKLDTPDLQQHVPGGHRSPTPAAIPESASKRDDSKKRVREEDIGKTPESSGPPGSRHRVDPLPRTPISDHPSRARPLISPVGERNLGVKHVTRERSPLVSSEESTRRETGQVKMHRLFGSAWEVFTKILYAGQPTLRHLFLVLFRIRAMGFISPCLFHKFVLIGAVRALISLDGIRALYVSLCEFLRKIFLAAL